eukprot:585264-Pyramimonas_sp.AAC.1
MGVPPRRPDPHLDSVTGRLPRRSPPAQVPDAPGMPLLQRGLWRQMVPLLHDKRQGQGPGNPCQNRRQHPIPGVRGGFTAGHAGTGA